MILVPEINNYLNFPEFLASGQLVPNETQNASCQLGKKWRCAVVCNMRFRRHPHKKRLNEKMKDEGCVFCLQKCKKKYGNV